MSILSFKFPLFSRSVEGADAPAIHTPICAPTRCRRNSVVASGIGGGSARYKGTLIREKKLAELIEAKVAEAMQVCEGNRYSDISQTNITIKRYLQHPPSHHKINL
ncbi:hypothetical protein SSX86_032769 [Deinandra increscens subsp. villosa]|uniref:Uncharacterized protein n=1 Tax=Deinandra increscens subsp. villosa TaxID=3103831 RepID=A0AAP0GGD7_9ASTR